MKIQKQFSITEQDYVAAFLLTWKKNFSDKKSVRVSGILIIICCILLMLYQISIQLSLTDLIFIAILLFIAIIGLKGNILGTYIAKKRYKKQKSILQDISLVITDKKVQTSRAGEAGESEWVVYSGYYLSEEVLVLMKSALLMTILPRLIFDDSEWEWLVKTASEKIQKGSE